MTRNPQHSRLRAVVRWFDRLTLDTMSTPRPRGR